MFNKNYCFILPCFWKFFIFMPHLHLTPLSRMVYLNFVTEKKCDNKIIIFNNCCLHQFSNRTVIFMNFISSQSLVALEDIIWHKKKSNTHALSKSSVTVTDKKIQKRTNYKLYIYLCIIVCTKFLVWAMVFNL